jgi:hypothetical protein
VKYTTVVSLAAAAALLALYVSFVDVFVGANLLAGATTLEFGIFFLQFIKVVSILAVKKLRNAPTVNLVDILGAELVVLLPGLVISDLYLGFAAAPSLMVQILLAWIAGVGAFATPLAAYRLARAMMRGEVLLAILPSAVFFSEFMILLVAGANAAAASGLGLAGLSRAMLLVGAGINTVGAQVAGLTALPPLGILYVSLLLYALSPGDGGQPSRLRSVAAFALLATLATYAGAYAASWFAVSLAYIVLPPALLGSAIVWWVTREG